MFEQVPKDFNIPHLEESILDFWRREDIERRYLERNQDASERFSFLDGPITANGPMAVHHAWGRTYKDLWQRYNTMLGKSQRYQNGFDCQGLWVEVSVEKNLGFSSKRDIEAYGIAEFVRKCKESVFEFADLQTRQSKRLGYFMDWDHSYYTLSDENNYTIWHFLKLCHERGLIYQGRDVMPWCTRCGTALSEHEIATEGYQELTHQSVYVHFPLLDHPDESLLVWTTTPWTLTSNSAVAVHPELTYLKVLQNDRTYYVARGAATALNGSHQVLEELVGKDLVGRPYRGPFDDLPAAGEARHRVIPWTEVSEEEGTGLVHIAPGCGKEDFALGKVHDLNVIAPIDQYGVYGGDFGWLSGRDVQGATRDIIDNLRNNGFLYEAHDYTHRYPVCWRCGTELVFRLVDEWFISMDPLRESMVEVARKVAWIPSYGLDRELDWLRNMDDWMISKKRYWGLALPFWVCPDGHLQVIGGKAELEEKALSGLDQLESPHRPWVDQVEIKCDRCEQTAHRIADVGNVWLDAGIVPYSTLKYDSDPEYWRKWFPAHFITESFPGQFRNWFYSMLAMSTVLEDTNPFQTVLGYQLMRDAQGREMHKSWDNFIPFDQAADRAGADTMRWLFALHTPDSNLLFGWQSLEEVKRRLLVLWNTYSFFVTYANIDGWTPSEGRTTASERPILDRWVLSRLNLLVTVVRDGLDRFDAQAAARAIEVFIEELSTWYVRRSRRRFWKSEGDADKASAYETLHTCLTQLSRLLAPFMPFVAESLYQNLVRGVDSRAPVSVHLTEYPVSDASLIDEPLAAAMQAVQQVVALGRAARDRAGIRVRQPLGAMYVKVPPAVEEASFVELQDVILGELNVKQMHLAQNEDEFLSYRIQPNLPALGPRYGRRMPEIRSALAAIPAGEVAIRVQSGRSLELILPGQQVILAPEDILVEAEQGEGYAAMAANGYVVALDTELSSDLINEGLAREIVRRINDCRKQAGFRIEDRIRIRYECSPKLRLVFAEHMAYICEETLAVAMGEGLEHRGSRCEASFGDQSLRMELEIDEVV